MLAALRFRPKVFLAVIASYVEVNDDVLQAWLDEMHLASVKITKCGSDLSPGLEWLLA